MGDVRYWVGLSMVPGIGAAKASRLAEHFGDLSVAWRASRSHLLDAGLDAKTADALVAARPRLDLEREIDRLDSLGVTAIPLNGKAYPRRLREIYGPPIVLYVRGELGPVDETALAVVGTRRCTSYGREMTERIVVALARAGVTIVSGLARGVDSVAHKACLNAGGRTVAVLGSGPDVIYPAENSRLAEVIATRGAIVSEYPLGTKPDAGNFPVRNRIVSGLSLGTLVVEAGDRSGALITAGFALHQNREVFAVPGSALSPSSVGTNRLIRDQGAKLVTNADDILVELNLRQAPRQQAMPGIAAHGREEQAVLAALRGEPRHLDDVVAETGLSAAEVGATMTMLELSGLVRHLGGNVYSATG